MHRQIYEFEKERWAHNARSEKWGVNKSKGKKERRKFLILGTGRTGSKFISYVFKYWGWDVMHERTGLHGTSTHFYHSDNDWYPMFPWMTDAAHVGERFSDFIFEHKIHVIRNPLTCIPSIEHIFGTIDWEFAEDTGILPIRKMPKRERVMRYWLNLNKKAEQMCDVTIHLENLPQELCGYLDTIIPMAPWPSKITPKNKGTGYRRSSPIAYVDMSVVDQELANDIGRYARRHGYEI
jgi:hypothetical protein